MPYLDIVVNHAVGLHARPASKFVQTAVKFPCDVLVKNISTDSDFVNAKSILGVLTLGVNQGHKIRLETNGDQDENALAALMELIEDNFGEV